METANPRTAEPAAGPAAGRVTVALTPQAAGDLASYCQRTRRSKTDAMNRAVSLLNYINEQMQDGYDVLVRRDGETQLLMFL